MIELIDTVNFPEWAIPMAENGPEEESEEDFKAFTDFLARYEDKYDCITLDYLWDSDENGFYWYPAFGLATGCIKTNVYGEPRQK
jgi:hypothetical protein